VSFADTPACLIASGIWLLQTHALSRSNSRFANLAHMSNPFADLPDTNPYASPAAMPTSSPPGNPLIVPAIFLLILSTLFLLILLASLPNQMIRIRAIDPSTPEGTGELLGSILPLVLWPLFEIGIAVGAISMIRLTSYRSAYSAAVLSVIPLCSPCFVAGIPFGIWAIVLLNRPQIRQRFAKS
jgi:hypothetical protein